MNRFSSRRDVLKEPIAFLSSLKQRGKLNAGRRNNTRKPRDVSSEFYLGRNFVLRTTNDGETPFVLSHRNTRNSHEERVEKLPDRSRAIFNS